MNTVDPAAPAAISCREYRPALASSAFCVWASFWSAKPTCACVAASP